ncbi:hypothetical protein [Chryseobacterium chendengshani]|uniref:hypothetical protein n=1 Tax=Chryseobacterium sp. LJ756 TaxID=2864113 RepID=UPI001C63B899|nr:hypothetical protein [Chryseobacterium sp. LJ756]MBW7674845.1 hypothetical protein [Chryseobacterium sp. LJ756]
MKLLTVKRTKNSLQLIDENKFLIGERLSGLFAGANERLKINDTIYKIKHSGFLYRNTEFFDSTRKLVVMIDFEKDRLFYYGQPYTEIYILKSNGWLNGSQSLYNFNNDELVMRFDCRRSFFKSRYEIQIKEDFTNSIIILAFLQSNIKDLED